MLHRIMVVLELKNLVFLLNCLGNVSERENFKKGLKDYFTKSKDSLCADCGRRLEKNTLRILDCKKKSCQSLIEKAPAANSFLTLSSKALIRSIVLYMSFSFPFSSAIVSS